MRHLIWALAAGVLLSLPVSGQGQAANPAVSAASSSETQSIPEALRILPKAPSATRDQQGFLEPGVDPQNRLLIPFVKHIASDQAEFWTTPTKMDRRGVLMFAGFAGFTGLLNSADHWITDQVPDKPSQLLRSQHVSNYALYSLIGVGGSAYLVGKIRHDDHMSETGLLSGEAAINSTGITYLLKAITQRPRPLQDDGNGTFFHGGNSLPSEHSAVAWSIASVVAHEYPGPLTKLLAYGLASTVTLTRVTGKQHFASDAFIGSALGWYFGRQVYRAHHDVELGGAPWGELIEAKEKGPRDPANMGSPYVPLDSWVYPAMDRLAAFGHVQSAFLGMRPWTRMECARLLEEAGEHAGYDHPEGGDLDGAYHALSTEFSAEIERLSGARNLDVNVDSIYTRIGGISGTPLRDGFHFGQTIVNDYGRPYGEGLHNITGMSTHAVAGPLAFYIRAEYQNSPSVPALADQARQAIQTVDSLPIAPPGTPLPATNRVRLLEGYVGLQVKNWQFTFGKQELWWGAGAGGPMLFSTNAEPITMLRISRTDPVTLPGTLGHLGPVRFEYILGRLSGQNWVNSTQSGIAGSWTKPLSDQPFIVGQKISLKPSPDLEIGIGATTIFAGTGVPFTSHNFLKAMFSTGNGFPGTTSDPGDRRGEFELSYRIPKLRDWLTFYVDAFTDDQANPWLAWNKAAFTSGLYLSRVPRLPKLDLRVEGVFTDLPGGIPIVQRGFFYHNGRFLSGYTNDGNLIGSWIGRQGQGAEAWTTYWLGSRSKIQLHFRHQKVSQQFIPDGGTVTDFGVQGDLWFRSLMSISTFVQYERWAFPILAPGPRANAAASLQVTFWPRRGK